MAEALATSPAARTGPRPSFHFWMALLMAFFVFGGFGMTYLGPLAAGTMPRTPPIVHLHGALFFAWMVLLVAQSSLVNARKVRIHRSLGNFGIALAGALVVMGVLISVMNAAVPKRTDDDYGLMYLSVVAPPSFAALFALAIRKLDRPAVHRNLILLATLAILMPGINRLYMMALGLAAVPFLATNLTMDAILAAILWHERRATGAISRATWAGAPIILLPQLLMPVVVPLPAFRSFIDSLASLVYYR
jgi:hypothetical protein